MAELPETAVIVAQSDVNNEVKSESTQSEMKAATKEEQEKAKHKVIKIKVLMIRQSSPFYVHISTSCTILELKKEIEKSIFNNNQITADKQRLIYKGHALKNKDTIFQCNIKDGHALHLVPQKSKPKPTDAEISNNQNQQTQQHPIIDHIPYKNVVCPKCTYYLCLTQPMLCYASNWAARDENNQFTLSQIVNGCNSAVNGTDDNKSENKSENKPQFDESKHGAYCDMNGCSTPNIRSTDYCYHCPNRRCHPFGYDLCQNCARLVDNPFINLNIATNHVLRYQLNMFSDIFYDRYRMLINRAIGGQLTDDEMKQESKQSESKQSESKQSERGGQRAAEVTVKMGGIDYVKMIDDAGNIILIPKRRIEELKRREKPLTINELRNNICNPQSDFRKRVAAVVANPRLIRDIFQKECPNIMRDDLWIRKFVGEAFEYIECRIYIQARMALNLQDIIHIVNDIINEQDIIRQNHKKTADSKILLRTFKILKANSREWIADEKCKNCQHCGNSFGYWTRKHHCKACGDIFCAKHCLEYTCKPNRSLMPNRTLQNLRVRLCDECKTKYSHYSYTNIPKQK